MIAGTGIPRTGIDYLVNGSELCDRIFTCGVCVQVSETVTTTTCCSFTLCEDCVGQLVRNQCPNCRARRVKLAPNPIAKHMLQLFEYACEVCDTTLNPVTGISHRCSTQADPTGCLQLVHTPERKRPAILKIQYSPGSGESVQPPTNPIVAQYATVVPRDSVNKALYNDDNVNCTISYTPVVATRIAVSSSETTTVAATRSNQAPYVNDQVPSTQQVHISRHGTIADTTGVNVHRGYQIAGTTRTK
ncbi:hypothetical protein SARC_15859, partial [Sphaeroforma arctica JP610]